VSATANVSYWLDEPYEPRPALEGHVEAEACVIGAGVAGLSCALALARAGVDTVVLERSTVAGGASGRNGGFLLAGAAPFYSDARERYGREWARRIYAATLEAQAQMYALAEELGAGDSVRRVGLLRASASEEEAEDVVRHVEALREDGFPGELVERDELPPALAGYTFNGCLTEHDGALQPARWIRTLARGAEAAGARIYDGTTVAGPVPAPGEGELRTTAGGSVSARHVVVASDGALPALVPEYASRVRSRRLHMTATAPLSARITDRLVYYRWGYEYFQQRPDGRLLIGGFSDVDGEGSYTDSDAGSPAIWERIERHIREDLGLDAVITHRWAGVVGYSDDALPYVGEVPGRPGLWVAGGYSGHGNVPGFLSGELIAHGITGADGDEPALFPADR
jgi:glycine/D-amino acid oxidase-like deaminating enzyme